MERINLSENDFDLLKSHYPDLIFDQNGNKIVGVINIDAKYKGVRIKDKYEVAIFLQSKPGSILPVVHDTKNKIFKIAKRKNLEFIELHLNNEDGELCLIIPPKEKEKYPNGFNLREFLKHLEEHFYWVSYYDRYNKMPWKSQAHGIAGYIEYYIENKYLKSEVLRVIENRLHKDLCRS